LGDGTRNVITETRLHPPLRAAANDVALHLVSRGGCGAGDGQRTTDRRGREYGECSACARAPGMCGHGCAFHGPQPSVELIERRRTTSAMMPARSRTAVMTPAASSGAPV